MTPQPCGVNPVGCGAGTFRDAVTGGDPLVLWDVGQNFGILCGASVGLGCPCLHGVCSKILGSPKGAMRPW